VIINIAGTSGSGKSYLIREFLKQVKMTAVYVDSRIAPVGYQLAVQGVRRPVHLVGAYETPTGGCDTISDVVLAYERVLKAHHRGRHVIYEGLFMMNMTRGPALAEEVGVDNITILQLTTPMATCIASINTRRAERGEEELLTKKNTKGNYVRAENYCTKMRSIGVQVIKTRREDALRWLFNLLR
jgi:hypothetical protein